MPLAGRIVIIVVVGPDVDLSQRHLPLELIWIAVEGPHDLRPWKRLLQGGGQLLNVGVGRMFIGDGRHRHVVGIRDLGVCVVPGQRSSIRCSAPCLVNQDEALVGTDEGFLDVDLDASPSERTGCAVVGWRSGHARTLAARYRDRGHHRRSALSEAEERWRLHKGLARCNVRLRNVSVRGTVQS